MTFKCHPIFIFRGNISLEEMKKLTFRKSEIIYLWKERRINGGRIWRILENRRG